MILRHFDQRWNCFIETSTILTVIITLFEITICIFVTTPFVTCLSMYRSVNCSITVQNVAPFFFQARTFEFSTIEGAKSKNIDHLFLIAFIKISVLNLICNSQPTHLINQSLSLNITFRTWSPYADTRRHGGLIWYYQPPPNAHVKVYALLNDVETSTRTSTNDDWFLHRWAQQW